MQHYSEFFSIKRLWGLLALSLFFSFSVLLYLGGQIYFQAPPRPNAVQTTDGTVIYSKQDIEDGQNIWQTTGGMQQGSIWGHGSYLAPDWSADWLHREALALLMVIQSNDYDPNIIDASQALVINQVLLKDAMRKNTYDTTEGVITVSPARVLAY